MMQLGDIRQVKSLSDPETELLEAVGVESLPSLAQSEVEALHHELELANRHLSICQAAPSAERVQSWIEKARDLCEIASHEPILRLAPDLTLKVSLKAPLLEASPVAAAIIRDQKIPVKDVPVMDRFVSPERLEEEKPQLPASLGRREELPARKDLEMPSELMEEEAVTEEPAKPKMQYFEKGTAPQFRAKNEESSLSELQTGQSRAIEPLKRSEAPDIRKAPSPGLNDGKKQHSRGYIRGVLNPAPMKVKIGAIITLLAMLWLPALIATGVLIVQTKNIYFVAIPAVVLVIGLLYLIFARGQRCRICGQPLFAPKSCRRHVKAHHIPFLGYILPTSLQLLIFHWFRCIYCGTSIRLKK